MKQDRHTPEVMDNVSARADIELDEAGQHSVGDEHHQHGLSQHSRECADPDEDNWNDHKGWGGQGTDYIDIAWGHVQDAEEDAEAGGKEGRLAAEQHLIGTLHNMHTAVRAGT